MPMTIELWGLVALAVQALLHISVQGLSLKVSVGNAWTVSSRDTSVERGVFTARAKRATENFLETAPAFIALALVILFTGRSNSFTEVGTIVYAVGRFAYLPAYLSGVPMLRTIIWKIATAALALMLAGIFL